ncbi:putative transmembrane-transport protein [Gordonia spumicola]|uniref:Putative transmembrane-transport protein n=1 Tax=Gordonia spumicola TaxID=589161 RepID=A0A7I9V8U0_9ACTN|nr:MFS transporter [Gordonia spumicola]GEE01513.1 putative transmembrane-transport protein [Gordonia spumicola]
MSAPAIGQTASRRTWFGLIVLQLPVLLVSMDFSVLYLAIPTIIDSLGPSATQQLWILDIYGFMIAGLLITMGNIGDRIGRRRILLAGAAVFGVASVMAAFAPSAGFLIAARALMGIGGATLMPASLSLIANMFPQPRQRARAIGVWTAAFAGGAAIGPVIGGALLHHYWWGVVFLINVPVLAVLFLAAPYLLPEFRADHTEPFDFIGVALSLLGILPAVYAVKALAAEGVSAGAIGAGAFGVVMLVAFLWHEKRTPSPLLDLQLFTNATFSASLSIALVGMMTQGGLAYLTNLYLQSVLGFDVLDAALAGIPMAVTVAFFSIYADRLTRKIGVRLTLAASVLIAAAATLGMVALTQTSSLWVFLVLTAIAGIGFGIQFSLVTDVIVGSAPPEKSGAASGISETSFELGTALGLALLGSLATAVFLSKDDGHGFADSLGETLKEHGDVGAVADAARAAFVDGLHAAAIAGGVLLTILAVVVMAVMRGSVRPEHSAH